MAAGASWGLAGRVAVPLGSQVALAEGAEQICLFRGRFLTLRFLIPVPLLCSWPLKANRWIYGLDCLELPQEVPVWAWPLHQQNFLLAPYREALPS